MGGSIGIHGGTFGGSELYSYTRGRQRTRLMRENRLQCLPDFEEEREFLRKIRLFDIESAGIVFR